MSVSLKEIAQKVNTSVASVSYALNNTGKLSEAKRAEILRVAKEMGYEPNFMAKGLKTNKTNTICVVTREFGSFYGQITDHISRFLMEKGYDTVVCSEHAFYKMKRGVFDAVILANYQFNPSFYEVLFRDQMPYLSMMSLEYKGRGSNVLIDNYNALVEMMELLDDGHERSYCFVAGLEDNYDSINRQITAEYMYRKLSGKVDFHERLYYANYMPEPAYMLARELLRNNDYNTYVCFNDFMAMGIYKACNEMGLVVGEDISIVGFDNEEVLRYVNPPITTIDVDSTTYAHMVVERLMEVLEKRGEHVTEYVPTNLIVRKSHKLKKGKR